MKLILHSRKSYQKIYNKYSTLFIEAYCYAKFCGTSTEESLQTAKILVQSVVSSDIVDDQFKEQKAHILKAYENLNKDTELIQKAIQCYHQSTK